MKKRFWVLCSVLCTLVVLPAYDSSAAVAKKTTKQSAIQKGTTVRTKTDASGLYDQACYDAYYGCMDQFCISDNESGGSCACSDLNAGYEQQLSEIQKTLEEADRIATVEVEKVKAGAQADIIFKGERQYDADGNLVDVDEMTEEESKAKKRADLMALFETNYEEDEDVWGTSVESIADKVGKALYTAADELCLEQLPETCSDKDIALLQSMYSRQITSDCKGFENSIAKKKSEADIAMAQAEADVRAALKESFNEANEYDRGTCMVEFKKCMQTEDACGADWENCVSIIAKENMQNNKTESTANTTVATVDKYDITASTMEILESKRNICEKVLNKCVVVRDMVWPDFLREAAPTIKVAEQKAESKFRQSCLGEISTCIQTACKDDIEGKGVASMDACLARPDMARSFCKVEIDPCERMEPEIWSYVVDKLKAMRVDACTAEVKECFTADTRCGENFQNCVGMDYDYIHDICPIDTLVVCKQDNPKFSMDDLDSMLMGLYLNIDNAFLDQCQNLVDEKMAEICGSTTDCNKFAADDTLGAGSLRSQKDGSIYRVTGMISFGSIKMGDATGKTIVLNEEGDEVKLGPGELAVQEYLTQIRQRNASVDNADGIISTIEEELNNITGTINRTIEMIEQDPEIQYCINGRDLSQITGKKGEKTSARFPNLLNQVKMQISLAALRQAQNNYNKKFNAAITSATKDASADLAQYMCQKLAATNGELAGAPNADVDTPLAPPYAISYDVGAGLTTAALQTGGHSSSDGLKVNADFSSSGVDLSQLSFGSKRHKFSGAGYTREVWSVFNREERSCHFCTSTVTQSCVTKKKSGFLGIGASQTLDCKTSAPVEKCEDIPM
ncbi:MAG: hypothetical protein IJX89_01020 [Alphaproteobacteria bacterium]|nr:hypothetical protein [Alphaproteobacteria bacterium]